MQHARGSGSTATQIGRRDYTPTNIPSNSNPSPHALDDDRPGGGFGSPLPTVNIPMRRTEPSRTKDWSIESKIRFFRLPLSLKILPQWGLSRSIQGRFRQESTRQRTVVSPPHASGIHAPSSLDALTRRRSTTQQRLSWTPILKDMEAIPMAAERPESTESHPVTETVSSACPSNAMPSKRQAGEEGVHHR